MQLAENRRLSVGVSVHAPLSVHPERSAAKSKGENKSSLPFDKLRASGACGRERLPASVGVKRSSFDSYLATAVFGHAHAYAHDEKATSTSTWQAA